MKYKSARQAWHDSFSPGVSPDFMESLMNLAKGAGRNNDDLIEHQCLAGKVQSAIETLPEHYSAWGHLCFSPDNIRNPKSCREIRQTEYFNFVDKCIRCLFQKTEMYDGTKSVQQEILCRLAVEHVMHLEQNGRKLYSENYCMSMIGKGRYEWENEGYQDVWKALKGMLHEWTGWTLEPVQAVINEYKKKRLAEIEKEMEVV